MHEIFSQLLGVTTLTIEAGGVLVIVIGIIVAAISFLRDPRRPTAYRELRATLGRAILLGLELLVAADIINTVAIEPSLQTVGVLAGIVLIRTFLSLSLEVEIEGKWPWQSGNTKRANASQG
ncbi:DUF1622 domain-containing protein [Devosia sp. BSSL-BM10]|jgi:uncharacterized membrane protein|uniref:DUF1622 domain-containing protein n=1 Tax=Devosia litorisediminis TaxID=2829817 RepID=A0A942I5D5_9HYPH|nr:DUF1622 domain-containing protein [Devosia litorisediminis]MBS3848751.1 DUF1622 domain-containing protein [Devosia litorisediminis]|tara:strand:- start:1452 stop:1817 length:366 start_codon:yes stop_codon:yes gene_type:complete